MGNSPAKDILQSRFKPYVKIKASPEGTELPGRFSVISTPQITECRDMTQKITILVADDDPDVRETIATILAEPGYTVVVASDGYEAVGLLADTWVNLLVTDVKMPGIDGFELARQAKVMRPQLHVIYLSGYSTQDEEEAGPIYGPILRKPLRMTDLLGEVSRQLG